MFRLIAKWLIENDKIGWVIMEALFGIYQDEKEIPKHQIWLVRVVTILLVVVLVLSITASILSLY